MSRNWGSKGGYSENGSGGRTFLNLGLLDLVVDGLLQVELVAVGELVDFGAVDLGYSEVHGRCLRYVWESMIWGWSRFLCALYVLLVLGWGE